MVQEIKDLFKKHLTLWQRVFALSTPPKREKPFLVVQAGILSLSALMTEQAVASTELTVY